MLDKDRLDIEVFSWNYGYNFYWFTLIIMLWSYNIVVMLRFDNVISRLSLIVIQIDKFGRSHDIYPQS